MNCDIFPAAVDVDILSPDKPSNPKIPNWCFASNTRGLVAGGALPLPAAIGAVLGANIGTTGTIWLAGLLVSDGMPTGITRHIAMVHTGVNLFMAVLLLPFANQIAKFVSKF